MNCTNTPAFQIINVDEPTDYPVTLEEIKAFSAIDQDYNGNDTSLGIIRDSAIQALEGALNLYFTEREVKIQFRGGVCKLPYGPQPIIGAVTSVVKNDDTTPLDPSEYVVSGLNYKTITIKNGNCSGIDSWFYPVWGGWPLPWTWTPGQENFYTVTYTTGYESGTLPNGLKHAILMLVDYFVKEQGTTNLEIPASVMQLASRFSKNLVIQ